MLSTTVSNRAKEKGGTIVREDTSARDKAYLEEKGLSTLMETFFDHLFQRDELPVNPYPGLVRRFRVAESAQGLFRSIEDDAKVSAGMQNTIATSPELSGVTYVQGSRGVWGMPHMLRMIDVEHLGVMKAVLDANELYLRADASGLDRYGEDCHVNVWIALSGPAALAGRLFREFWAEVQLIVSVEIVTLNFELAVEIFAETILVEAKACQGSTQLLLRRVVIDFPLRQKGVRGGERKVWTPQQLHDDPDSFITDIKTSLPFRPSVTMAYLLLSPTGTHRAVGGPIMSIHRSYTMHFLNSTKSNISLTNRPFRSLYGGVFLSGAEAKHYGETFRKQGMSFAVEGVAGAKEYLADNVERAREIGDTLGVHASLLPLAFLSGVNEDGILAGQAVVDVSRVLKSAAARHRSRRNLCDFIVLILVLLADWVQASQPVLTWEGGGNSVDSDSGADENNGRWNTKTRCCSSKDLLQTWLRTAHLLFWGWRCDVLRYLDEDRHSDVAVVKAAVKSWIEEISDTARMGLRLPMLRWYEHGRAIADGKRPFFTAVTLAQKRLSCLSAWLHCVDLSLSWDAAKVCDRVHARHLGKQNKKDEGARQGGWPNVLGLQLYGHGGPARENTLSLPTTAGLLQLQRSWLDGVVAAAYIRGKESTEKSGKRKGRRQKKQSDSSTADAIEAALVNGVHYVPAPAAPDSTRALQDLNVRLAVVETLREDAVPEAFAHEMTLMKYAADNRVDKSLRDSISKVLTSVLAPNPFPVLADALALSAMSHVFWRTVDSEDNIHGVAPKLVGGGANEHSQVFVAEGAQKSGASVYGSKPALTDIDVKVAVSLFHVLPPIAGWVLDELGGSCTDVDVGIFGCAQQHGLNSHHAVPSKLTVMLACACDFNLRSGTTPIEYFARCAVHCASTAHTKSGLLVLCLTTRMASEDSPNSTAAGEALDVERFLLEQILNEPQEVEDELVHLHPEEIVLEALVPYSIPIGGEALVPLSIRLILTSDGGDGSGCSKNSLAAMFYNCVYSTARAAENAAARLSALKEDFGLSERYAERTRRLVLERVDRRDYLEAYRLIHYLRSLRSVALLSEQTPTTPESDVDPRLGEYESISSNRAWKISVASSAADVEESAVAVTTAIRRMLKGPAGRLRHARQLLDVLRMLVMREILSPQTEVLLEEGALREHAGYCASYLLDTLAEQPLVRFEGAGESIKLRVRLLLDRVTEMGNESLSKRGAQAAAADATREAARDLAVAVTSMLEIVQLAVEFDTHRCCPEMDQVIKQYRAIENRTGTKPPAAGMGSSGRQAAVTTGGIHPKSAGTRNSNKSGGGRSGRRKVEG